MTDTDTTSEYEELSGTVLRIIGAYGMGTVLDAGNPSVKTSVRHVAPPEQPNVRASERVHDVAV
jgi:hypothetical protein